MNAHKILRLCAARDSNINVPKFNGTNQGLLPPATPAAPDLLMQYVAHFLNYESVMKQQFTDREHLKPNDISAAVGGINIRIFFEQLCKVKM